MPTKDLAAYDGVVTPALTDEHIVRASGGTTYNKTTQQILNNLTDVDAKTSEVDADTMPLSDSAASNVTKKITFANLKAYIFAGASALGTAINAFTGKTTPVDADNIIASDSAASHAAKKVTWANVKATLIAALGALISGISAKTTPVDADNVVIDDSADSHATKKVTWANVKATLKAYFDTLYSAVGSPYTATTFGAFIDGIDAKATPVDADSVNIVDSADSNIAKKVTWANVKATLVSLFCALTGNQTIAGTKTFSSTIVGSINGNAATVTNGVYTTGNQSIAGVKTFSDTTDSTTKDTGGMITEGGVGIEKNIVNGGYLKSGKGRWPSGHHSATSTTQNILFDLLSPYIPNINDEIIMTGVIHSGAVKLICAYAYRYSSTYIIIEGWDIVGSTHTGITLVDGSETAVTSIYIAW